jgi:hypothetical protein
MPNGIVGGVSNLTSQTGETIRIDFEARYSGPSQGSAAWNIDVRNIRITLVVPGNQPLPAQVTAQLFPDGSGSQTVTLVSTAVRVYSGAVPNGFLIRAGDMGLSYDYHQYHEFTPLGAGGGSLVDPMNGTPRFQTNFFYATPFATAPQGLWSNL